MNNFRSIDGANNNGVKGKTDTQLLRLFSPAFEDGIGTPRGGKISTFDPVSRQFVDVSTLPNPRTISNLVIDEVSPATNALNASDWLWQWGQLIDHDLALNEGNPERPQPGEFSPIVIEDPNDSIGSFLPFVRVSASEGTGESTPRQIDNQITAFIDGSFVYGSDRARADFLRDTDAGKGLLKTTESDNGEEILPLNRAGNPFGNATGGVLGDFQFLAGDVRANEHIGLTAGHSLLVREHNRVALGLSDRLQAGEAELTQQFNAFRTGASTANAAKVEDDFLYESARKVIGAKIQAITYEEFLPLLIGDTLEQYQGFDRRVDPQLSVEFANAAFRLGHTMLSNQLRRVDSIGIENTSLSDAFFAPEDVQANGVDSLLIGLAFQGAQAVDNQLVDSVREFLFPAGTGGLDLGAVNIARGRETGIGGYTEIVEAIGGPSITSFAELRASGLFSAAVVNLFETAYESVDQIDLWLGGIAEQPDTEHGGLLGPTLSYFIAEQFARSRDGDKFFYLNDLDHLNVLAPDIESTTLAEIIRNNVSEPSLVADDAFKVSFERELIGDSGKNRLSGSAKDDAIDGKSGGDRINGRGGDDILFGGSGQDTLLGQRGNDRLFGGGSKDKLNGQSGDDYLTGGNNDDILKGGEGDDVLSGDRGNDFLKGGKGHDTFLFGRDLLDGIAEIDTISGFEAADTIDLSGYLGAGGTVSVQQIGQNRLLLDLSGEDSIEITSSRRDIGAVIDQISAVIA
ncbi:MAG: peroxidase family protein [Cyanobacteria bacterium P01_C01_bin.69]